MSRQELDKIDSVKDTPKKKSMSVDKFFQQFNTLDMNNYGSWPISVKITCWLFILFVVCAIGYFLVIKPKLDAIDSARAQEQTLLNEFKEKDSKLRNLQQYQAQLQQMQIDFTQQLEQLPKETEVPDLVEDINMTGVNSGLKFKNIRLESEVRQEFFIEQPIAIEATGDYHSFGRFVSSVAALPRIVTLHDFTITAEQAKDSKSDVPIVNYSLKAKTYRYIGTDIETVKTDNTTQAGVNAPAVPSSSASPAATSSSSDSSNTTSKTGRK